MIGTGIWGQVSANCDYQPGQPNTAWTFGNCSLGVNPATSVVASDLTSPKENWNFPTVIGDPAFAWGDVTGAATPARPGATGSLDRAASVSLHGNFTGVGPVDLSRATVVLRHVLFDPHAGRELVRSKVVGLGGSQGAITSSPLGPVTLRPKGHGSFQIPERAGRHQQQAAGNAPTVPRIKFTLKPRPRHSLAFSLKLAGVVIPAPPAACAAATTGLTSTRVQFPLTLKLSLRQPGRKTRALSASPLFSCQRDRTGAIRSLTVVRPRQPKFGRGLSVQTGRPRRLTVGQVRTFTATVRNRTRHTAYDVSIWAFLPHGLRVVHQDHGASGSSSVVSRRLPRLRRGKARVIRFAFVPTAPGRRYALITADAILRKQAASASVLRVTAAPRAVRGLG